MPSDSSHVSREQLRAAQCASASLVKELIATANFDHAARRRIHDHATQFAIAARRNGKQEGFALGLVHRFGLNTPQGIALMQLAEALPRTTDAHSARLLIADKIGALTWRGAVSDRPSVGERLALYALDTVSKIFREPRDDSALQSGAQRVLQKAITALSHQYVLGEGLPAALRKGRKLARAGCRFSFDMLGEAAMTDAAALNFQQSYLHAIESLATQANHQHAISVKLSALHPRFEERQRDQCLPVLFERIKNIAVRARAANLPLTLDAEESDRLELTLDVFEQLLSAPELSGWNGLGLAVQAYQHRTLSVIDYVAALAAKHSKRISIRLVKGAYWDTEIKRAQQLGLSDYPIFVRKCDTDVSYLACARRLLSQPARFYPQFATHNAHTIAAIIELAEQTANKDYEFQRLHGMGEHLHTALLRAGLHSRIYAPIGPLSELLPYLVRRLLENGASSSFVRQLTDTSIPINALVLDPFRAAAEQRPSRTCIAAPNDVRNQSWPSANGFDLTARDTSAALLAAINAEQTTIFAMPLIDGTELSDPELPGAATAILNPANRERVVGQVIFANDKHVQLAVAAAVAGHAQWSAKSAQARAAVLENAAQLLEKRAPQFIHLAVHEAGKTIDDAIGEVREAVDFCRYYAEQCRLPAMQNRESLGVVACISPWNFPLAIFLGQITAALAAGNTVVAKPAEQTPLIAMLATRLLHEAGIPMTALQLLPGEGHSGATLVGHADVAAVCFTGSMATAKSILNTLAQTDRAALPLIAETGGINAMLVDSSSLPEQVVRDVLTSAFQSAGQRCSALRVLCLQAEIADQVLTLLRGALANLLVGDPATLDTDVGPLIDADAQQQVLAYIRAHTPVAQASLGAKVGARGWFVAPCIIEVAHLSDVQQEVFGPVLHVIRFAARELPTLVQEINQQGYGLTLGIHSRIRRRVQNIVDTARVGNIYVNRHQVGALVGQQPFGGHGLSGTGPKAGGPHYLLRLSKRSPELTSCASIALSTSPPPLERITLLLALAHAAQAQWARTAHRSEMIQFACQLLAANTSQPFGFVAERLHLPGVADLRLALASIAGESNDLYLRPRGVLLCLSAVDNPIDSLAAQLLLSVATGNGALLVVNREHAQVVRELVALLVQSGMPENLVSCMEMSSAQIPTAWLTTLAIDAVVFDGTQADRHRIAAHLNQRPGAILPLLNSTDDVHRFCWEQTVTINTAAAGGDPHLLGITT